MEPDGKRLAAALGLHAVALGAHTVVARQLYPKADSVEFQRAGAELAAAWWADPMGTSRMLLALLLQRPGAAEHGLAGSGATDTVVALSAAVQVAVGPSFEATALVFGAWAFAGAWLMGRSLGDREAGWLAALMVPSVAFWTSGVLKEAVALGFLGVAVAALLRFRAAALPVLAAALVGLGLVRPWALGALGIAALALVPSRPALRWGSAVVGTGVAVVAAEWGARALGAQPLSHRLAWHQLAALADHSASAAPLVDAVPSGLGGQLLLTPAAVLTAWFRPGLWEAHSALAALAGLENLALVGVFAVALWRAPAGHWVRREVVFALVFCGVLGAGIGLTTANLGTLGRYRALLAPLLWWVALAGALGPERRNRSLDGESKTPHPRP